jgi:hypothetical protein
MIIIGFGNPGSGKTTLIADFVRINDKKKNKYNKKNSKSRLYRFLTEPLEVREEFHYNYREKINGKIIEYAVTQQVPYSRKDHKWYWRLLFNLLFKKNFYDVIYATDPTIKGTVCIDYDTLGTWKPTWNSCMVLEEAGIGISNRNYKNLSADAKELFALHRHKGADLLIISQTVDVDKAARQRAAKMFIANKLGPFTSCRMVKYRVGVNNETHQIEDLYTDQHALIFLWQLLTCWRKKYRYEKLPFERSKLILRCLSYSYFDSFHDDHVYTNKDPYILKLQKIAAKEAKERELQEVG